MVGQLESVGNGPTSGQREITFSIFGLESLVGADGNFCSSVRLIFNSIRGELLECCRARRSVGRWLGVASLQIFQSGGPTQLLVSGTRRKRRGRGSNEGIGTRLKILLRRPVTNCEIDTKPL